MPTCQELTEATPAVGQLWEMKVVSGLPERANETVTVPITKERDTAEGRLWQVVTTETGKNLMSVWFGRDWFVSRVGGTEEYDCH